MTADNLTSPPPDGAGSPAPSALACVVLAHADPAQTRRLIDALAPFPVLLHCDRRTDAVVFAEMTADLPARVTVLERIDTPWAAWGAVEAEIAGYRAALAGTDATHIAMLSGSDYPLVDTTRIADFLAAHATTSFTECETLPRAPWGRTGGMSRLRFRHRPFRKHMLRWPLPRKLPQGITFAGGSPLKVLARHHVRAVVDAFDQRPELSAFWRSSWCPDETFVPSLLFTEAINPGFADEHILHQLWYIDWQGGGRKSPEWLNAEYLPQLRKVSAAGQELPKLFARKFSSTASREALDQIDRTLRAVPVSAS